MTKMGARNLRLFRSLGAAFRWVDNPKTPLLPSPPAAFPKASAPHPVGALVFSPIARTPWRSDSSFLRPASDWHRPTYRAAGVRQISRLNRIDFRIVRQHIWTVQNRTRHPCWPSSAPGRAFRSGHDHDPRSAALNWAASKEADLTASLPSTRPTCMASHFPFPVAVGTPRSFNAFAMPLSDVTPAA
jgi:hypothetical protein